MMPDAILVMALDPSHFGKLYERADKAGLFNLTLLLLLSLAFGGLGRRLIKKFSLSFRSRPEEIGFSYGLGLLIVSYTTFLLGVLGLLYPWLFRALALLLGIGFARDYVPWLRRAGPPHKVRPHETLAARIKSSGFAIALALTLAAFVFFYGVAALTPELEFDALNYHLGILNFYLSAHKIVPVPTNHYSGFPFGMEMIYLGARLIKDVYLAKLFHFLCGVWVVVLIYAFAKRYLWPALGLLAGVIFYTTPVVGMESKTAYVDLALAAWIFLSVYAILNWYYTEERGWFYLSAVFCGAAAGTKYTGVMCGLLVLPVILYGWMAPARRALGLRAALRSLALFGLIALAVFSPWLIKNYIFTANPFHPFLTRFFPNPYMAADDEAFWVYLMRHYWNGSQGMFLAYRRWSLLWDISVRSKYGATIGPIFMAFIPAFLGILVKRSNRPLIWMGGIGSLAFLVWAVGSPQVRFAITFLPYFSLVIAWGIYKIRSPGLVSSAVKALVIVLLALNSPFLIMKWHRRWIYALQDLPFAVVFGDQSRDDYVALYNPAFPVFQRINQTLPPRAPIFTINLPYQLFTDRPLIVPYMSRLGTVWGDLLYEASDFSSYKKVTLRLSEPVRARHIKIRQTGSDPEHFWSIYDLRVFQKSPAGAEVPRDRWGATANYNPAEVAWAFDTHRIIAWATHKPQSPDMYYRLDLGQPYEVAEIVYITSPTDWGRHHQLEISQDGSRWSTVDYRLTLKDERVGLPMTEALNELRRHGVRYILFQKELGNFYYPLMKAIESQPEGVELLFRQGDIFLYKI